MLSAGSLVLPKSRAWVDFNVVPLRLDECKRSPIACRANGSNSSKRMWRGGVAVPPPRSTLHAPRSTVHAPRSTLHARAQGAGMPARSGFAVGVLAIRRMTNGEDARYAATREVQYPADEPPGSNASKRASRTRQLSRHA